MRLASLSKPAEAMPTNARAGASPPSCSHQPEVHRPGVPLGEHAAGAGRIGRDLEHAREVVAATAGEHAEHRAGQLAQRVGEHADEAVAAQRRDGLAGLRRFTSELARMVEVARVHACAP